jgi:hypothetical protein
MTRLISLVSILIGTVTALTGAETGTKSGSPNP